MCLGTCQSKQWFRPSAAHRVLQVTRRKVLLQPSTSSMDGGKATSCALSTPCTTSMYWIQCRMPECTRKKCLVPNKAVSATPPEFSDARDLGQLPNTATTLAFDRQVPCAVGSSERATLSSRSASSGVAPLTPRTVLSASGTHVASCLRLACLWAGTGAVSAIDWHVMHTPPDANATRNGGPHVGTLGGRARTTLTQDACATYVWMRAARRACEALAVHA